MVGWHHQFNGHEFEKTPGYSEGHGMSLACCSPSGHKEVDTTEQPQFFLLCFIGLCISKKKKIVPFQTREHNVVHNTPLLFLSM